ncbi:hypothetical protein CHH28_06470 [Bacterioplanes sanyensis]|uniref:N-acetyltransferase domain-containing protein n=1 Tax=Bacterioplanes sanyensis TaxID=1249553 RepID=A0A222FIC9_9GAMM|nr:GNAT family N-acetyltransferase [Bacterioplanes sanyensis]ASP38346.1 hypothetical protein CHH28_06470 [Bacterioplanes sanyensis]
MTFEALTLAHAEPLLAFEQRNREYFERLIAPRPDDLFSSQGMIASIAELLQETAAGLLSPWVLMDGERIIARANLHHIQHQRKTAEVGYRVDELATGQGVATRCLQQLKIIAQQQLELTSLTAKVLDNNPASAKVLIKQGFVFMQPMYDSVCIQGVKWRGQQYVCTLNDAS